MARVHSSGSILGVSLGRIDFDLLSSWCVKAAGGQLILFLQRLSQLHAVPRLQNLTSKVAVTSSCIEHVRIPDHH